MLVTRNLSIGSVAFLRVSVKSYCLTKTDSNADPMPRPSPVIGVGVPEPHKKHRLNQDSFILFVVCIVEGLETG